MPVTVVTDSASGIPTEIVDRLGIMVVPLYLSVGDESRPEASSDIADMNRRLSLGPAPVSTSQPSPADFAAAFEAVRGDVLAVLISSRMSSTLHAAELGRGLAQGTGTRRSIQIVDSGSNSMQEGFAVIAAAECARGGGDIEACRDAALASVARSRFLFAPRRLDDLVAGGRIADAVGLLGSALRIVPILTASDGVTGVAGVARSRSRALDRMAELMRRDIETRGLARVAVQVIADVDEAEEFAATVVAPMVGSPVEVIPIPASIAVHVGPAIGLVYETVEPLHLPPPPKRPA